MIPALTFVALLVSIVLSCLAFHERGYNAGLSKGEALGREKEREWIINREAEMQEARESIWREEAS
jgi:hypothetical protein